MIKTAEPLTTARKVHTCHLCGFPIYVAERYVCKSYPPWKQYESGGYFWTLKACRFCFESGFAWSPEYQLNADSFPDEMLEFWLAEAGWPGQVVYGDPAWWCEAHREFNAARRAAWDELAPGAPREQMLCPA